ncbi:MAG: sigma-70 family RNA polymerase sigma factor [Myxococcus sp.]|nr:sigma-70 family RNA polymerase sigma factor [Myxococcus sp.]
MATRREAFGQVYKEHLSWMLHTVRRLGVRGAEGEDAVHDVFATAWRRLDTYSPERPLRPWLFGIAFRVVANRKVLRSGKETPTEAFDHREGHSAAPDAQLQAEQTRDQVIKALDALPLEQRALFVGHDIEQTPITDLARELEVPLNTAYSRLRLARQRFEQVFQGLAEAT